jgi:peptidoglycan/LPS O-acetylase OafA/YrhL
LALIDKIRYRPEIDGLRAIAVGVVLLFHGHLGATGGYVGVDVFFVISGFLITSLIWNDLESGRFTFSGFWERRARRIVPALVVVTLVTLAAGWFLLLPAEMKSLGRATASQALFAANVHYWLDSGYFASASDEMPLLHTWSLALEEQYYLIVPFVFWGLYKLVRSERRGLILAILAAGLAASLGLSAAWLAAHPSFTFYLLPTRAWELLLGSIVVFLQPPRGRPGSRAAREVMSVAGLAMIVVAAFAYSPRTPFPGFAAVPPCLGTALLIWSNGRRDGAAPTLVGSLLSTRPIVFVGLISYSLYLWHWPMLAFANGLALEPVPLAWRIAIVGVSFPLAVLSWRFVETPFRTRQWGATRKSIFALAGLGLLAVLVSGAAVWASGGAPGRFPPAIREVTSDKDRFATFEDLSVQAARAGRLPTIGAKSDAAPAVLVWGDSHAIAALPAIDALLEERGLAGRVAIHSATAPVLDWYQLNAFGLGRRSLEFGDAVLAYLREHRIRDVILVAYWSSYGSDADGAALGNAAVATIRRLVAAGCRPAVLLDVPIPGFDVPKALALPFLSEESIAAACKKPGAAGAEAKFAADLEAAGAQVLDPKPRFIDPARGCYAVSRDGAVLYYDSHHVSRQGALRVLLPFLRDAWKTG